MTRLRVGLKGSPAWPEVRSTVSVRMRRFEFVKTASEVLFDLIV